MNELDSSGHIARTMTMTHCHYRIISLPFIIIIFIFISTITSAVPIRSSTSLSNLVNNRQLQQRRFKRMSTFYEVHHWDTYHYRLPNYVSSSDTKSNKLTNEDDVVETQIVIEIDDNQRILTETITESWARKLFNEIMDRLNRSLKAPMQNG